MPAPCVSLSPNSADDFFSNLRILRNQVSHMGRSILLWLVGVPIPIIILLALFWR